MPDLEGLGQQKSLHVAYLGPEASFSHQAAIEVFQDSSPQGISDPVSLHPLPSFPAIFSAIQNSPSSPPSLSISPPSSSPSEEISYDYVLLPIENSTNGSVVQVLDLLAQCGLDSNALYPDLEVCAEYYLPVHHCLFVSFTSLKTQYDQVSRTHDELRQSIRTIYTHPQVWGQCTRFLSHHFHPKSVERIDVGSTSAAAQLVAAQPESSIATTDGGLNAAIGSKLAGHRHSLICLDENIEDEPGKNTTRFFVVRNKRRLIPSSQRTTTTEFAFHQRIENDSQNTTSRSKSLLTFTIPHTKPGALADALAVFKKYGFNLTSIDTRPGRRRNWQYVFFVECEEETLSPPVKIVSEKEWKMKDLLEELGKVTESLRYLGSFVDRLPREEENGT